MSNKMTFESAAAIIADGMGDPDAISSEYVRGQIDFALTVLGYEDDGYAERERLTAMVADNAVTYPAGTEFYVVSFEPRGDGGGVGGFNWFLDKTDAAREFVRSVNAFEGTFTHTLWTFRTATPIYGKRAVTDYLDETWCEPNEEIFGTRWTL